MTKENGLVALQDTWFYVESISFRCQSLIGYTSDSAFAAHTLENSRHNVTLVVNIRYIQLATGLRKNKISRREQNIFKIR